MNFKHTNYFMTLLGFSEKTSDTEYYRQGFNSCISALLDKIPVEFQEKGNLKGLRNHLETFLVNLTTEADTMAYATAMGSSPYIQSPSANWYQQQNVRDAVNVINQSNNALPNNANGTHYSAANDKLNCRSNNLLCSVPGNPKWYSDWNIEMQMQYMEAYQSQPSAQDVSPYDVFQGIKSVYSNYLQDEEGYYSSFEDSNPTKNSCVKHEADSTESILTPQYGQEPGPNSNNVSSKLVQSTDSNCCVLSERTSTGTKTQMCDTPVIKVGQSDTRQIWRPW